MPEGDTVHRTARILHAAFGGERLTACDLRVPRFSTVDLRSETVTEVVARGKHLLMRTDGALTVHSHLGMEGQWRVTPLTARLSGPRHEIRAILETEHSRATGLRLRILEVLPTREERLIVGGLGPDVLGADWDLTEAGRRMRARQDITISEALLDQSIVAGFGNVYRNELCFLRGYHPDRLVAECDVEATLILGKRVMETNREHARHVTTGNTRPGQSRYVYGRRAEPCRRCGTPIQKRGDPRVTYWCPNCQR